MNTFNPGLAIKPTSNPLGFDYGSDVFGPEVENRELDSIRTSLANPNCEGPEIVYSIAMDVGKKKHLQTLKALHLLYGVVTYASGRLGEEPVRSQGHIHATSQFSDGWSTPEVYEIWKGKAIIYMQETANDQPGRCFAVYAKPGEVVIVPPAWAHATISADPEEALTFGAWCIRDYAFLYDEVRAHKGLAWFPLVDNKGKITWNANPHYLKSALVEKSPESYAQFGLNQSKSIYEIFEEKNHHFDFVVRPGDVAELWKNFTP